METGANNSLRMMNDASETAGENIVTTTQSVAKEAEDCEASDEYSDSAADIEQSL